MSSPTPSLDSSGGSPLSSLLDPTEHLNGDAPSPTQAPVVITTKCPLCDDTFTCPKVLPCFHTFCLPCLEKTQEFPDKVICPKCRQETLLPPEGVVSLISDYAVSNLLETFALETTALHCTGCKSKESNAVARCFDCANFLCSNCVMAHQFMHCFEGHRVHTLVELQNKEELRMEKPINCRRHKTDTIKYFCTTCNIPICKECTVLDHPKGIHEYDMIADVGLKQVEQVKSMMDDGKLKATDLRNTMKSVEHISTKIQVQYHKAQNEINETFTFYKSMIEERKQELLKELEGMFNSKQMSISVLGQKMQDMIDKIAQISEFVDKLMKNTSTTEILMFKKLLDSKLMAAINYNPDLSMQNICDLEFVSNYQAIQVGVRNTFGYIRSSSDLSVGQNKQPPIARPVTNGIVPVNGAITNGNGVITNGNVNGNGGTNSAQLSPNPSNNRPYTNGHLSPFESTMLSKRFNSQNSLGPFPGSIGGDISINALNPYEKWSNGAPERNFQNGGTDSFALPPPHDPVMDLSSKLLSTNIYPPKSQIKRQKMIYHCKFGEFGVMEGQFTEPSGVAVNAQNDIIVADTNNHRIQIFDKEGRFKFQFGECGKRDGQLLYPNRVAVVKTSGDIIVTERSPTHQIQIYNQYGQFVRKFGANILQHPRGVTVDCKGRIIVVECKVMRVIIFDQLGTVLHKFGCSKHLEFPNGVVVNDKQEIFISDNRAHCVKVFNYEGVFLRQIGGEGITNYPIGVGINSAGEILIADNHNNFNLTIFTQDGQLVNALESKVKHAQCFDVALMDDGSVVLASKDYRLYIYRYIQVPPIGL